MNVALIDGPHQGTYELRWPGAVVFVSNRDGTMDVYVAAAKRARDYVHVGRRRAWLVARAPLRRAGSIRKDVPRR
jgi:hypothetical protein